MIYYTHILISCALLLSIFDQSAGLSDDCLTSESHKGKCIPIGECPSLLQFLKKKPVPPEHVQQLQKASCGFQGVHPKVCCPLNPSAVPEFITATLPSHELAQSKLLPDLKKCGTFMESRILLGEETELDAYPWTVLLEYSTPNGNGFHCGGALINNRYVLTAAHCISGKGVDDNWKLVSVRFGEYDRDSDKDCDNFLFAQSDCCCTDDVLNVDIEETIVHEQYDPLNQNQYDDIALLRLATNVRFTDFIRPICLQPTIHISNGSLPGQSAVIAGWGLSKLTSNSNKKHWAMMEVINNSVCEATYAKKGLQLREDQLCALAKFDRNPCPQDSGGALMKDSRHTSPTWNYFAIGVMSIANPICGLKEYPVVYTKVKDYIPWIITKLKP